MSGFFGSSANGNANNETATSRWGGLFKQAISNVETTFDSLLEQPPLPQQQQQQQQIANKGNFSLNLIHIMRLMHTQRYRN
jgi:hypothetical protein